MILQIPINTSHGTHAVISQETWLITHLKHNITVGSVILGNNQLLKGHQNHILNYFISSDSVIYTIDPQNDKVERLDACLYMYYRLYPDGTQVPTHWVHNLVTKSLHSIVNK